MLVNSLMIVLGLPRTEIGKSTSRLTRRRDNETSATATRHFRVQSSKMARIRSAGR
jgi:hypothetical protein